MATDTFIALDRSNYFNRFLYSYNSNLYQLIPALDSFFQPLAIQMWKSTDGGSTWSVLASSISLALDFEDAACAPCLLGTSLYLSYFASGFTVGLAYFDFTADSFVTVATTASPSFPLSRLLAGPDSNHLFTIYATTGTNLVIGEYVSNAFSVLATLNPVSPYTACQPQAAICGSSGILHILYEATKAASAIGPSDLGYLNVVSGTVGGTIGSQIVYPNFSDSFLVPDTGTGLGPPLQIGGTIYASFYDPLNQKLRVLSFPDVASPTFTITDIDPAWAITGGSPSNEPGEGSWSNMLAYYGTTLYCFYDNTWVTSGGVYSGDSTLYYRSSTDGGATWSTRTSIITHLDPVDGIPFKIWYPQAMQFVGTPPTSPKTAALSYNQAQANSHGQFGYDGRFVTILPLQAPQLAKNYVRS